MASGTSTPPDEGLAPGFRRKFRAGASGGPDECEEPVGGRVTGASA